MYGIVVLFTGTHTLVATGVLHSVNTNRIVCKKLMLSGHPLKINKRSAVIRYMFFTRGILFESFMLFITCNASLIYIPVLL